MFFQTSARTDTSRKKGSRRNRLSIKDVIAQAWGERISPSTQDHIAWSVLSTLVSGLQETLLPLNDLKGAIASENVEDFYSAIESFDPQMYVEPALLLQDRIVVDLFSKLNWVSSPFNKRERAKLRFWEAEEMCKRTNSRLFSHPGNADVEGVIHHARNIIQSCLGTFCPTEMLDHSRFGPGATLCVTGNHTTPYFKLSCTEPTVGTCAFPYAEALLNHDRK